MSYITLKNTIQVNQGNIDCIKDTLRCYIEIFIYIIFKYKINRCHHLESAVNYIYGNTCLSINYAVKIKVGSCLFSRFRCIHYDVECSCIPLFILG